MHCMKLRRKTLLEYRHIKHERNFRKTLLSHHGPTNCPHGGTFASVQGSELMEAEGLPVTLVGHTTQCAACGQSGAHAEGAALLEVDY
jgi:uncharacterized Zn-binding protein involved in type VI secretion